MIRLRTVILTIPFILLLNGQKGETDVRDYSGKEYSFSANSTEKKIHELMNKHNIPAFAISIVNDQDIMYQKAFGISDIENNIHASTKTVFKLWSVAKVFTAIEIFREVEEGLIDLDYPLTKYLPDFRIQSRNNIENLITIKSILAHRSGLPRNECVIIPEAGYYSDNLERFEEAAADCYLAYPVGYRYKYSNLGYDLLGRIIEQTRGEGFVRYMEEHLLFDLGMKNSTFNSIDIRDPELIAKGYEFYKGKYYPMIQSDISSIPSGNLYSTIEDLSIFLKSVFRDEVFKNCETMSQMFIDYYSNKSDPERMGLGWKTTEIHGSELMVWHDGGPVEGIGSLMAILPYRKIGVAVIGNGTSFQGNISVPFVVEIISHLLGPELDTENNKSERPLNITIDEQILKSYEGKYPAFGQMIDIRAKKHKLRGTIGGIALDMVPVNEREFRVTHWMDRIGLTWIFKPPFEFDKVGIIFQECNLTGSNMIINLDNISFEICPRYPEQLIMSGSWDILEGEYQIAERLPCKKTGNISGRRLSIYIEDHIIIMSYPFGPIFPLDDKYLVIASGPFAGEIMEYFTESGNIIHQNTVYIPVNRDELQGKRR